MIWIYAFCQINSFVDALNDFGNLGAQGYELVQTVTIGAQLYAIFKKRQELGIVTSIHPPALAGTNIITNSPIVTTTLPNSGP